MSGSGSYAQQSDSLELCDAASVLKPLAICSHRARRRVAAPANLLLVEITFLSRYKGRSEISKGKGGHDTLRDPHTCSNLNGGEVGQYSVPGGEYPVHLE